MTDAEITRLIEVRNTITNRRDLDFNPDTGSIDAQLATVPPGQRNDVDLLLGRPNAVLPDYYTKPGWIVSQAVTLEEMKRISADAMRDEAPIEY